MVTWTNKTSKPPLPECFGCPQVEEIAGKIFSCLRKSSLAIKDGEILLTLECP
jgi:hypothetical protein